MLRGLRNHNPGNIRHGQPWEGLAPVQADPVFCTFAADLWGIRAICVILLTYADRHGWHSVWDIVSHWAPPQENDSGAYADFVADRLGVARADTIDVHQPAVMERLVAAIIAMEDARYAYPVATLRGGMALAGITYAPATTLA